MSGIRQICLLGFGEVGQILAADFQAAVGNQQWGYRLTSAYALLRLAEQNDEIIRLLGRIAATLDRLEAVEVPHPDR